MRRRKDGTPFDISLTVSPLRDADGRIVGASKIARDITERKEAEQRQHLLVAELSHRVKNTLATVNSIARQSLKGASSEERAPSFGALLALAQTHGLLRSRPGTRPIWRPRSATSSRPYGVRRCQQHHVFPGPPR